MVAILQISKAAAYLVEPSRTSGALYHNVTTYKSKTHSTGDCHKSIDLDLFHLLYEDRIDLKLA